jgi:hypothetical protein
MAYPEKTFPLTLLSINNAELLQAERQAQITAIGGTQVAYALPISAAVVFVIPAARVADYAAANQAKKEVMAAIYQETVASAEPFDAYYNARYLELYP